MTHWHSLYLSSDNQASVIATIESVIIARDYTRYNPFTALPGKSYPQTFKVFIAPPRHNWIRLLLDGDNASDDIHALIRSLSAKTDVLSARLDGDTGSVHSYRDGGLIPLADWCLPHLKQPDTDVQALLNREQFDLPPLSSDHIGDVPVSALPDEIQQMAREVNVTTAGQMFRQLSNRIRKTIGFQNAGQLLNQATNWDSQGGQMIRALMAILTIPDDWRTPDFATLRSAYIVKTQHEAGISTPDTNDASLLKSISSLDAYQPVYGGKF